jgi:outer membrane protein assembly factor BamB
MNTRLAVPAPALVLGLALLTAACSGASKADTSAQSSPSGNRTTPSSASWPEATAVPHDVLDVGFAPHRLSAGAGSVWVASMAGAVHRVDGERVRLLAEVGSALAQAAPAAGQVFVGDNRASRVLVFDERSGERTRTLPMPGPVRGVLAALDAVWVTTDDKVVRLDPTSMRRLSVTTVGGEAAQLAQSGSSVVVTNRTLPEVSSLDAEGRLVGTATTAGPTIGVAVTPAQVWVLHTDQASITVLSRERFSPVGVIELPGVGYGAATVGDEVWVTLHDDGTVARLTLDGEPLGQFTVGRQPLGILAADGLVWVANEGESTLWRLSADLQR